MASGGTCDDAPIAEGYRLEPFFRERFFGDAVDAGVDRSSRRANSERTFARSRAIAAGSAGLDVGFGAAVFVAAVPATTTCP